MQDPPTERICLHPLCDRPVGRPEFALTRREREAREYGYCVSRHPVSHGHPDEWRTSGMKLDWRRDG